ncbi:MAG TPA: DNA-3-methyladenine glycosylase I [Oceanospirillaceae bacterium]|nr:DNA-3-methyladenine glycosylase I [Oceanospirillaceae bacterium]
MAQDLTRCGWVTNDPVYLQYHDEEWGRPVHDDQRLFEQLVLEGAQAGLSWITILKRRHHYRRVFKDYHLPTLVAFSADDIDHAMQDTGIIRNRKKVESVVNNAACFQRVQAEFGSFDAYVWGYVDGVSQYNKFTSNQQVPAQTDISEKLAKDMKKRGFKFVGPIGMYAFMQSIGMVNDHLVTCHCHAEVMD